MNRNYFMGFVASAAVASAFVVGCGDDTATGGAGTTTTTSVTTSVTSSTKSSSSASTTSSTHSASSTGAGACGVPADTHDTCEHGCALLYDCAALTCSGTKLCPGVTGDAAEKTGFIGDENSGCVQTCMAPGGDALLAILDPTNCQQNIDIVKSQSTTFTDFCANGAPGTGGAGGAP